MLPHSTDREVTLFGTAASIGLAGRAIAQIMQQQALANEGTSGRGPRHGVNVPYTPGRRNVRSAGAPDGGRRVAVNGNGNMFHGDGAVFSQDHQAQPMYDGFYAAGGQPLPPPPPPSTAHTQEETSQTVYIPNDMVGAIIGRGGSKINDIRLKSGAQVRIEDAPVGNDMLEREVTVSGTPAAIKIALFLLHRRMENERKKHAMATSGNSDSAMRNESAGSSSMPTRDPSPMDNSLV